MTSPSRRSNFAYLLAGAVMMAVLAGVLGLLGTFDGSDPGKGTSAQAQSGASSQAAPPAAAGGTPTSVADIYSRVSPAVVFVAARSARRSGSGSGFVIGTDGRIVTNEHVVEGATDVRVRFGEDGDAIRAKVVGQDPSTDVALLKIDPAKAKVPGGIKALELADSKRLRPGEATIAIGAPFGLAGSVTTGVVSALNRDIQSPNGFSISGVIQTDAAINPGNSGGPLLDAAGRAIGVNSQIATNGGSGANSGVGFAVPIDTVKEVVPALARDGEIKRPYLGVSTSDPASSTSAKGATVQVVVPRGPASASGLRRGDRIVAVAGKPVAEAEDVAAAILNRKPGERVEIRYVRGGKDATATVRLGTRPDQVATQRRSR